MTTTTATKRIILFPQDKGGIGKSFVATLLHDFLLDEGVRIKAFDLDHANSTFQRFVPEAEFIDTDNRRRFAWGVVTPRNRRGLDG